MAAQMRMENFMAREFRRKLKRVEVKVPFKELWRVPLSGPD
jgi:hypothetical protein